MSLETPFSSIRSTQGQIQQIVWGDLKLRAVYDFELIQLLRATDYSYTENRKSKSGEPIESKYVRILVEVLDNSSDKQFSKGAIVSISFPLKVFISGWLKVDLPLRMQVQENDNARVKLHKITNRTMKFEYFERVESNEVQQITANRFYSEQAEDSKKRSARCEIKPAQEM
jgi:hypothetical protein